jgi:hypothetical protein
MRIVPAVKPKIIAPCRVPVNHRINPTGYPPIRLKTNKRFIIYLASSERTESIITQPNVRTFPLKPTVPLLESLDSGE